MKHTIHVPENFEHLDLLEHESKKLGLSIEYLPKSKSFNISGIEQCLTKFLEYAQQYKSNGVSILCGLSNTKKSYVKRLGLTSSSSVSYFTPVDISKIYGINTTPEQRVGIAIIELGGGYNTSDLTTYWNYLGLKTIPNVVAISVDGAQNTPGSGADYEVILDIEVIGGICPNSNIYVYFAPNTDSGFYDAINAAITSTTNPVSTVSISWGSGENYWPSQSLQSFNALFQKAAELGITVCVASGDNSSSDGESSGNHVDFPASSPWVLSCGGTTLVCPDKNYSSPTTSEKIWGTNSIGEGAGGGFSTIFSRPSYQTQVTSKYTTPGRGVPDVCGVADPSTGWQIYIRGSYQVIGGTSAVAPMWAAILGSINFKKFANPVLYNDWITNKSICHDITLGNNGYSAGSGWDPASGLGSPNGSVLLSLLTNSTVPENPPVNPVTNVIQLQTITDYNTAISQKKCIINYCATWCSACIESDPIYNQLSLTYPTIKFCKIDIQNTNFNSLLSQYQIKDYPTFYYFYNGTIYDTQIGANSYLSTTKTEKLASLS